MTDYMCLADNGIMPSDAWFMKLHVHCKFCCSTENAM